MRAPWQRWSLAMVVLLGAGLLLSRGVFAQAAGSAHVVSLTVDGQKQVVSTDAGTVSEVLRRARVVLEPKDLVEPAVGAQIDTAVFYINVYRAKSAVVVDGEREILVESPYQNPRLIATRSAGLKLNPEDGVNIELIRDFVATPAIGQRIVVQRSLPITISVDGRTFAARTLAPTAAAALAEKGVQLGPQDSLNVKRDARVRPGMHLIVKRVGREVVAVEEAVPAPVRYVYDGNKDSTYEQVQEAGSEGRRLVTYRIVRHDGQEVERTELQVVVITQPRERVIVKGTRLPAVAGADWAGLRFCESGGNYANTSNPYYRGAYQFSYSTWAAMGGSGDPAAASPAEQDQRALMLYQRSGRGQWPVCGPRYLP